MSNLNDNLQSIKKLESEMIAAKFFSLLMSKEQRTKFKEIEEQLKHLKKIIESYNKYFPELGWCAYDHMNTLLMEKAVDAYEKDGPDAGEKVLIEYYKTDVKDVLIRLKHGLNPLAERKELIEKAFEDHFAERYHASVPLFLIIIDGSVNDFTKSKGFFAEGTDVTAWDCLVGCDESLTKIKSIFNKGRPITTHEEIRMPYRNGILHGRDLNFANEYVSCKCVSLLFAISDWMNMKCSEERRKEIFNKKNNPPPISESLQKINQSRKDKEEIRKWNRREIKIGINLPATPTIEECTEYPYVIPIVQAFSYWQNKNYGELSRVFKNMFSRDVSDGKRAGECRSLFNEKEFISFKIKEIEERDCSLTKILVQASWKMNEKTFSELLEFGCAYQDNNENIAFPWRENGQWVLIPWNVIALNKSDSQN